MAKEPTLKLCMFCGDEIEPDQLTKEHFVPKGLWEKGRRPDKTKRLPAHKACNQAFSDDNEYFRDVLAMEEGVHRHPEAKHLQQGAIQRKLKDRLGSIVKTLKNVGMRSVRTPSGIDLGMHPAFEVDWKRMHGVLCNVMKGIFYVSQNQPLPKEFVTFVADVRDVKDAWISSVVRFMVPWQSFGDTAFRCRYVVSSKRPFEKMTCLMQFYEHRSFIGEAISPTLLGDGGELFVPARHGSEVVVPRWAAE